MLLSHNSTGVTIDNIDTIAIDAKNNNIFLFYGGQVVCINETEPSAFGHSTLPASISSISAAAAYNGMVFFAAPSTVALPTVYKLFVCKAELSGTTLTLTKVGETQSIDKLRTEPVFGNNNTNCTGLFADESGVYCLLNEQGLHNGNSYALGKLIRCTYSGSTLTDTTEIGLNPAAPTRDPAIAFDARYFSNPVGFIGYDEDYLYIADNGANIGYINENLHLDGNKNRIAAFNRKTGDLSFSDTGATWYAKFRNYKKPNTKVLLWENTPNGMNYWTNDNGSTAYPGDPDALLASSASVSSTDVFCYDQDGNLYILWHDGPNYKVKCFTLDGDSYDKSTAQDLALPSETPAIAVDVSDGNHYLYYVNKVEKKIKRYWWPDTFSVGHEETGYSITVPAGEEVTALAANRDGVFVATKKQSAPINPYTLRIRKYKKNTDVEDGIAVIIENAEAQSSHAHGTNTPYNTYDGTIHDLQVVDGVLYAITAKIEEKMVYNDEPSVNGYVVDEFKSSGILYKIGSTAEALPSRPLVTKEKPADDAAKTGYGFYRFIAVKPKKLVIASDGAFGTGGMHHPPTTNKNNNKILEYDLDGNLNPSEVGAGGKFSKELEREPAGSGFAW